MNTLTLNCQELQDCYPLIAQRDGTVTIGSVNVCPVSAREKSYFDFDPSLRPLSSIAANEKIIYDHVRLLQEIRTA